MNYCFPVIAVKNENYKRKSLVNPRI